MRADPVPPGSDTSERLYTPPSLAFARAVSRPWEAWFQPVCLGLEEVDLSRPALWVGNHARYGVLDTVVMVSHVYTHHGVWLRGLADNLHFRVPGVRQLVLWGGGVPACHEAGGRLMRAGEHVLVYPGGVREVTRRRGEDYDLFWRNHAGFARLAIAHGYDIIPFGAVGPDEAYRPWFNLSDARKLPLWARLNERFGLDEATRAGDLLPPVPVGVGGTILPKPQRFFFGCGPRLSTAELAGQEHDDASVWALRERVAAAVREQLVLARRARDAERSGWPTWRRWLTA